VYIDRMEIGRLLYCLNWYIRDLISLVTVKSRTLSESEKIRLRGRIRAFRRLKAAVLTKLALEGFASVGGMDQDRGGNEYYRVKVTGRYGFHVPKNSVFGEKVENG